jgi:hypothetical protein
MEERIRRVERGRPSRRDDGLREHLEAALDNVLAVLAAAGGLPMAVPNDALDAALAADRAFGRARRRFYRSLKTAGDDTQVMAIEEAANAMAGRAAEAGYRLGSTASTP